MRHNNSSQVVRNHQSNNNNNQVDRNHQHSNNNSSQVDQNRNQTRNQTCNVTCKQKYSSDQPCYQHSNNNNSNQFKVNFKTVLDNKWKQKMQIKNFVTNFPGAKRSFRFTSMIIRPSISRTIERRRHSGKFPKNHTLNRIIVLFWLISGAHTCVCIPVFVQAFFFINEQERVLTVKSANIPNYSKSSLSLSLSHFDHDFDVYDILNNNNIYVRL